MREGTLIRRFVLVSAVLHGIAFGYVTTHALPAGGRHNCIKARDKSPETRTSC
jgi:hypothetical protein